MNKEIAEPLVEAFQEKTDAPFKDKDVPAVVEPQIMQKISRSGHRKYLWISLFSNAVTMLLNGSIAYMSFVLSDIGEMARFSTWTWLLLVAHQRIFGLLRPKKGSRVWGHFALTLLLWYFLIFSATIANFFADAILIAFGRDRLGDNLDICKWDDALGKHRCTLRKISSLLSLVAPFFMVIAGFVLKRAAVKRCGSELVPVDPVPKVAAWKMVTLEDLEEDNEPNQV